jgi:hypothetical protein
VALKTYCRHLNTAALAPVLLLSSLPLASIGIGSFTKLFDIGVNLEEEDNVRCRHQLHIRSALIMQFAKACCEEILMFYLLFLIGEGDINF